VIPPPQTQEPGPVSFHGREYCIDPVNDFRNPRITDEVLCFGSQSGKTTVLMAGVAWTLVNDPTHMIWVMPSMDLARAFSETRWQPMLRASPGVAHLIPKGAQRHDFKKSQQALGGSVLSFVGSNSPANLASRPCRVIVLDEVDKFDKGGSGEADAVNLAEQRTKTFAAPKRFKTSTPTLADGLIWQEYLKGDQRRYYVPCPSCQKQVLFSWSPDYTVLPKLGCEAYIRWDEQARRTAHDWDLARVERSARAECPFCKAHILDSDKTWMLRHGEWRATAEAPSFFVSRHLSSLYAVGTQTSFGALAVQFLQAKRSMLGLQGFVNGVLAEPWEYQDSRSPRVEIVVRGEDAEKPLAERTLRALTVDCQGVSPYYWAVVREWSGAGDSRLLWQGHLDTWEEIRKLQLDQRAPDSAVLIDSGFQAADVYMNCLRYGQLVRTSALPVWKGWIPAKGRERESVWRDKKTNTALPYLLGSAPLSHRRFTLPLLEFNGDLLLDVLAKLRKPGKTPFRWELTECVDDEYYRQLDAKVYRPGPEGRTGKLDWRWRKRSARWPDHLLDCEIMQLALATFFRLFPWGRVYAEAVQAEKA